MPKGHAPLRLDVRKGYKLFIAGAFVRSESGRTDTIGGAEDPSSVARASRADLRAAIGSARSAFARWSVLDPAARGLALYRLAELLEARRALFVERLRLGLKREETEALREATTATDRTLWYAGWCDKYAGLVSARNPVAGPYFCYSAPEPVGVVGVIAPDEPSLLGFVSMVVPPLVAGNSVVAIAPESDPRPALEFAECVALSDLPAGTLNVLTGRRIELAPALARDGDVDALDSAGLDAPFAAELERLGADNLKRVRTSTAQSPQTWFGEGAQDLAHVTAFAETKTIWHPAGI